MPHEVGAKIEYPACVGAPCAGPTLPSVAWYACWLRYSARGDAGELFLAIFRICV